MDRDLGHLSLKTNVATINQNRYYRSFDHFFLSNRLLKSALGNKNNRSSKYLSLKTTSKHRRLDAKELSHILYPNYCSSNHIFTAVSITFYRFLTTRNSATSSTLEPKSTASPCATAVWITNSPLFRTLNYYRFNHTATAVSITDWIGSTAVLIIKTVLRALNRFTNTNSKVDLKDALKKIIPFDDAFAFLKTRRAIISG